MIWLPGGEFRMGSETDVGAERDIALTTGKAGTGNWEMGFTAGGASFAVLSNVASGDLILSADDDQSRSALIPGRRRQMGQLM
jgi:hypothetical protein